MRVKSNEGIEVRYRGTIVVGAHVMGGADTPDLLSGRAWGRRADTTGGEQRVLVSS